MAGDPVSHSVDGDNGAEFGAGPARGRVAYLNLRKGISGIRPRTPTLSGVADVRGGTHSQRQSCPSGIGGTGYRFPLPVELQFGDVHQRGWNTGGRIPVTPDHV